MSLNIYLDADPDTSLSDGDYTNPFATSFDGRTGGVKEFKLYLRNDDPTLYYTDIIISLEDEGSQSHIDGSLPGFEWKLASGDLKPTVNDWAHIDPANSIDMSDLGNLGLPNTNTYLPFWVYIKVPANTSVQAINTIKFVVSATESLV